MSRHTTRRIRFMAHDLPKPVRLLSMKPLLKLYQRGALTYYGAEWHRGRSFNLYKVTDTGEVVAVETTK